MHVSTHVSQAEREAVEAASKEAEAYDNYTNSQPHTNLRKPSCTLTHKEYIPTPILRHKHTSQYQNRTDLTLIPIIRTDLPLIPTINQLIMTMGIRAGMDLALISTIRTDLPLIPTINQLIMSMVTGY